MDYKTILVEQHYHWEWSWKLVNKALLKSLENYFTIKSITDLEELPDDADVYLIQTITLIKEKWYPERTILRVGGNRAIKQGDKMREEIIQKANSVIATNKFLYDYCKKFNENVYLIPNGLDLDEWKYIGYYKESFVVGFAGNISSLPYRNYKGYDYVFKAVSELGLGFKTALFGSKQIPHNEMLKKFYSQISVFVLPTKGEGANNCLMEALAVGVPVMTTKTAGFHGEFLTNWENVVFIERDVKDIKEKLLFLKSHPEIMERLSVNGRKFAEKYHDVRKIAEEYKKVIESLIRR